MTSRFIYARQDIDMDVGAFNGLSEEDLDELCTSGLAVDAFVGIIDPLRPDVPHSVAVAQAAGVKVKTLDLN